MSEREDIQTPPGTREVLTFCRICAGKCGMKITVDDSTNRMVDVRGDHQHAMTSGYACIKGLQSAAIHHGPQRLLKPLKKQPDGSFAEIPLAQALDEIAARIRTLTAESGADTLGLFRGTAHYSNSTAFAMMSSFIRATRTRSRFSTMTIDQSAKWVAEQRLGNWGAGRNRFNDSDVWMFVGYNPLVSLLGNNGTPVLNPTKRMKEARVRGMKFIVVDPRRTETAHYADIHLQLFPGEDPTLFAGLLRCILANGWEDREFCARHVNGLDALRRAVDPFTPEYVERRAGVPAGKLIAAAELFASTSQRGIAVSATGPDMAPRSNLAEHLIEVLNVVCGRFLREGDTVQNPGAMSPRRPIRAEVIAPGRSWETGYKSRVRNLGTLYGEKMAGALADEILTPGDGQIRALIVDGGNPVNALPERGRAIEAMQALDLLVTIDPYMSETAQLAHYILPPTLMFERADLPLLFERSGFPEPFAQYTPAVLPPPAGSEVVEDWYVFYALAQRLGLDMQFEGTPLDMQNAPSNDDLLALLLRDSEVPFDEIKKHPGGKVFELPPQTVAAAKPERAANRFEVMPADVFEELAEVAAEDAAQALQRGGRQFGFRLSVRRSRDVMNTTFRDVPAIRKRVPYNPVFLNPQDLQTLGLVDGAPVFIESAHGRIEAIAEADATMRQGVISMFHGFGKMPNQHTDYEDGGVNINDMVPTGEYVEPINAMPWYSAVPVDIVARAADEHDQPQRVSQRQ
ncbi:MAG: molybdopterin-dependent oxidoreductase [Spongiibacteraceae bacterium]